MKLGRPAAVMGIAGAVLLVSGLALVGWFYSYLHRPYAGWSGESVIVKLSPGLDAGSMLRELSDAGVVRRAGLLRRWLSLSGAAGRLHAGGRTPRESENGARLAESHLVEVGESGRQIHTRGLDETLVLQELPVLFPVFRFENRIDVSGR